MDDALPQLIQTLHKPQTVEEAFNLFCSHLQTAGYDETLFTFLPESYQALKLPFDVACKYQSTRHSPLIQRLTKPGYLLSAPLLCPENTGDRLVDWFNPPESLRALLSEKEQIMIMESVNKHGLRQLLTLTVPLHHRGKSIFCFSSQQAARPDTLTQLHELAKNFHVIITSKREFSRFVNAPIIAGHTIKERRLLKFLMQGAPIKAIPKESEIGQFYGEKLVKIVRAKWGNANKTQLVYHVAAMGLDKDL